MITVPGKRRSASSNVSLATISRLLVGSSTSRQLLGRASTFATRSRSRSPPECPGRAPELARPRQAPPAARTVHRRRLLRALVRLKSLYFLQLLETSVDQPRLAPLSAKAADETFDMFDFGPPLLERLDLKWE